MPKPDQATASTEDTPAAISPICGPLGKQETERRAARAATKAAAELRKKTRRIPTYAVDGRRLRDYAPSAIERLLEMSLVVVRRSRQGLILVAQFRDTDGANPMRATALIGTRYSFRETVSEYKVWAHRPLISRRDLQEMAGKPLERMEAERFVASIFGAVAISALADSG